MLSLNLVKISQNFPWEIKRLQHEILRDKLILNVFLQQLELLQSILTDAHDVFLALAQLHDVVEETLFFFILFFFVDDLSLFLHDPSTQSSCRLDHSFSVRFKAQSVDDPVFEIAYFLLKLTWRHIIG